MAQKTRGSVNPRTRIKIYLAIIFIVAVLGACFNYPKIYDGGVDYLNSKLGLQLGHFYNLPFRLGLDLRLCRAGGFGWRVWCRYEPMGLECRREPLEVDCRCEATKPIIKIPNRIKPVVIPR